MTVLEFLALLRSRGISVWAEDERLRYSAPAGAMTPALLADLRQQKASILALLRSSTFGAARLQRVTRGIHAPLSFTQEGLWLLHQVEPVISAYNIPLVFRLMGPLDTAALQRSLDEIVRRHEALRTTFDTVDGQPVQVVAPYLTVALPLVDLRDQPVTARQSEALRLATEEAWGCFLLTKGPLLRSTLFRLTEEEHVLCMVMHHIVSDDWSLEVFLRELSTLYEAFCQGRPSPLADVPVQYADFAIWQRELLQRGALMTQLAYWERQLQGAAPLELPTDHPRPAEQTHRGARYFWELPATLTDSLTTLSRREGSTLFMTLLAAFQILLYRHAGQEDVCVGSPIANRSRVELEGLIGFFVNMLVLRTDLAGNPTFRELLGRVREVCLAAYSYQDMPFEKLVEALRPQRDISRPPLFQVSFSLQNGLGAVLALPGLIVHPLDLGAPMAKVDLECYLQEAPGGLRGTLVYSADLFDATTVERLVGHFQVLLAGIVADPEQHVADLPLLTAAERQQLLVGWNDTRVDYPPDVCVHDLVAAQAARSPAAVAVVFGTEQVSYRELDARANRLAHFLRERGVGPGVLVGMCVERSVEMVVGLLGILKAGGAYVPLDPDYPAERLAFMVEDGRLPVVLTQARLAGALPLGGAEVVRLDADWAEIARRPDTNPVGGAGADDLAYVIYTSGSTGRPKGVQVPHRGVVNWLTWMQAEYRLTSAGRVLHKTSLNFDASVWEVFWPLITGARLVVARPDGHKDSAYLIELIDREQITVAYFVPSMLAVFLEDGGSATCTSLRQVLCGGEALPYELQERFFARLDGAELHNSYGPTETTIGVLYWACQRESGRPIVPIGFPIANTRAYVLDGNLQPVPVGVVGELHIGGVPLAWGYLRRPELTAEKFIPNPFSPEPGQRLYKTGDMTRYLPDGAIEFLGRADHQVKLRGIRIEPGEIEAALGQHADVHQSLVVVREDLAEGRTDQRLVAYVVPRRGAEPAAGELRRYLKARLPEYMVPAAFVRLDALPVTSTGKVDRRALPLPERSARDVEEDFVAPRSPAEARLAAIWGELLGLERVGVHDNFFDLGGHSLLATQVMYQVRSAFHIDLPLRSLFEWPTVAELAAYLEQVASTVRRLRAPISSLSEREDLEL